MLSHRALVKNLGGDVFRGKVNALAARLFKYGREQPHLELKRQHIHTGCPAFAALGDDLFDEQPPHGQVDRADHHQSPIACAVEKTVLRLCAFVAATGSAKGSGLVGAQDQFAKLVFFLGQGMFLFTCCSARLGLAVAK